MAEDWKSYQMRRHIVQQIDEHLRMSPTPVTRSAVELEDMVFQKATRREEYMEYVNHIFTHFKKQAQNINQNPSQVSAMLTGHGGQPNQQMTDARMPNRPNQMISGPTNPTMTIGTQQMGNMPRGPRMTQAIPSSLASSQSNDMNTWDQNNRIRMTDMQMSNMNQNKQTMNTMAQGKMNQIHMTIAGQNQNEQMNPVSGHGQLVNISGIMSRPGLQQARAPSPSTVYSGGGIRQNAPTLTSTISTGQSMMSINNQPGQQTSPAFISPSPSNMVLSPASQANQVSGVNRGNVMGAPSPGSNMVNTPQQGDQQQSPAHDWEYMEKVKQLQKYVEPLKRMIENGGISHEKTGKAGKMKILLDTLQNPSVKVPMETLRKCEHVLKKLEMPKDIDNSLVTVTEAIAVANKTPRGSHIINRTISPALKALLGPSIYIPPKKIKRKDPVLPSTDGPNISNLVQGEVARLSPRFKVNLDCLQTSGTDDVTFSCNLDDPNLPCVPAITLIIPSDYPKQPPQSCLPTVEYNSSDFLRKVNDIMACRQSHLPRSCTISMILDLWEMSIRQACSPKPFTADSVSPLFALTNV